jgi:DNA-binding Lrp family transcriptional regulator
MAEEKRPKITLYVQSKKVVTSFYRPPASTGLGQQMREPVLGAGGSTDIRHSGTSEDDTLGSVQEEFFLSDDQARCLAMTEELAATRGYQLEVEDVGKAGRIERLIAERLRGVSRFPVLVGAGDLRLEGVEAFTEEKICEMMPTELHGVRAFTYLKVRGGDLDRIRELLLVFPQVRELHLLTGDWDVFVVMEFPESESRKRQILDFVTERIRGIPEVLDTSTLVPEFSVTKFPT